MYEAIKGFQKGDRNAIIIVINDFKPLIKKLSKNLYYEEAETDLIIALIKTLKQVDLDKFDYNRKGQLVSFIHKTLKNKQIDLYKKKQIHRHEECEINLEIILGKEIDFTTNIFINDLLGQLNKREKEIICKKYIYQISETEIAKSLNITRQAVNRTKNKALNRLKKYLIS